MCELLAKANLAHFHYPHCLFSTLLAPLFYSNTWNYLAGEFIDMTCSDDVGHCPKCVIFTDRSSLVLISYWKAKQMLDVAMPLVSMFGIACIIVIITAAWSDSLLEIGALLALWLSWFTNYVGILHWFIGMLDSSKWNEKDCENHCLSGMQIWIGFRELQRKWER